MIFNNNMGKNKEAEMRSRLAKQSPAMITTEEMGTRMQSPINMEAMQQGKILRGAAVSEKIEIRQGNEVSQKIEVRQVLPQTTEKKEPEIQHNHNTKYAADMGERKRNEFQTLVTKYEGIEEQKTAASFPEQINSSKVSAKENVNESKKQIQQEMMECSKMIREIQHTIKETYQFKPCGQLCELLVNLRQHVYRKSEDIQEDLMYAMEAFGIEEFTPRMGEIFDSKYHKQVYTNVPDARGRHIDRVYSSGFRMDGEIIMKAQVSVI